MKVLLLNEMKNQDTPENRKALIEREAEKFKSRIIIPESIRSHVHEGFDPLLVSHEIIDKYLAQLFNAVLDFDSS